MNGTFAARTAADFEPVILHLRDGRKVTVRAVKDEDKAGLTEAFEHLSADSRYSRFMGLVRELTPAMLERATHVRNERDLALVAVVGEAPGDIIVGGARYAGTPEGDDCEFAVTVADDWQGLGLARRLMELLMAGARERGFFVMEGFILTSNTGMRRLAQRLGFEDGPMQDDPTVRVVRRRLDGPNGEAPS